MITNWLILDVATAPITDAALYLEGSVRPPSNYKDPDKIAEYIAEKEAERLQMAATDMDLARVTGVCTMVPYQAPDRPVTWTYDQDPLIDEEFMFRSIVQDIGHEAAFQNRNILGQPKRQPVPVPNVTIITFGGFNFDLPFLMRRARYLGVDFPALSLDRYKSPHVDLCEVLSDRNPQRRRSLQFYAKRLGMGLVKPLSGAEESQVPVTGKWDELAASLRHDVLATYKLACWLGVIQPADTRPEPEVG